MSRALLVPLFVLLLVSVSLAAKGPEMIDLQEAQADPDFLVQGEYAGEGVWPGGDETKLGAHVIAQGDHKFRVVIYRGGLPGDSWARGDDRLMMDGETGEDAVVLGGAELVGGRIAGGRLTIEDADGRELARLTRIERTSPTLGAKPPQGAIVLFDGTNVDHFPGATLTPMKTLQAGCTAKDEYRMRNLHLEFRLSWKPQARGQGRSNSGVYIGGIPEIQVLDSFGLEGAKNECGAFYGRREPDVNMCYPPLVWQTYDVEFSQPAIDEDGRPRENILVTVRHNGVVIHQDYDTGKREAPLRRLHLQSHGNHVQYRNIWLVEAESPPAG